MIPLSWYLVLAAALFSLGLFAVLARRNVIAILMGIELMFNAVNLNLIAFWRYLTPDKVNGLAFALIVFAVTAAEAAVGLAIVISLYRQRDTINADEFDLLRW